MSLTLPQGGIINTIFALIIAIILVAVFWSIVTYFTEFGSEEGKKEGKSMVLQWSTYLLLIMIVYGVVEWIRGLIGL
jgi:cell division protein FtsX